MSKKEVVVISAEQKALQQIEKEGVVRYLSRRANLERKAKITEFAAYVGSDGIASSSPNGFAIFISSEIKKAFGCPIKEMSDEMLSAVIGVETSINQIIDNGKKQQLPRIEIRQRITDLIRLNKQQYDIIRS